MTPSSSCCLSLLVPSTLVFWQQGGQDLSVSNEHRESSCFWPALQLCFSGQSQILFCGLRLWLMDPMDGQIR